MANAQTSTAKPSKEAKAEHYLIGPDGVNVEREEDATGIRYVDIASGETVEQQSGGTPGEAITMWANFGLKTLATNVASGMRQAGRDGEQVQAIKERFALNETGVWMDRTREIVPTDLDKAAEASTIVLVATGRIPEAKRDAVKAALRESFEDPAKVKQAFQVEGVKGEYNKLLGKGSTKTVDDLAAIAGLDL